MKFMIGNWSICRGVEVSEKFFISFILKTPFKVSFYLFNFLSFVKFNITVWINTSFIITHIFHCLFLLSKRVLHWTLSFMKRNTKRSFCNTNLYIYFNVIMVFPKHPHLCSSIQGFHNWALGIIFTI